MQNKERWLVELVFAPMLAFSLVTGADVLWGYSTPGDLFANGNSMVYPSYFAAVVVGLIMGFTIRWKAFRALVVVATLASLWYWVFVPGGWWAHEPPGSGVSRLFVPDL
ncbi:MAG TPA: hypothetical protein VGY66_08535 [Gemmataceae bacterium]|nr:hypothetical protein [Gemmataceae bacterium]